MIVHCTTCNKTFNRKPSKLKEQNYCSHSCRRKQVTKPCENCGKEVTRCQSWMLDHVFCSRKCSRDYTSARMTAMNEELNPERMTIDTRTKLRESRLDKGEGKTYAKTFSRHTHRIVAEQMLGRKLRKGEVVHHKDEDKRNNDPSNLIVFPSQAIHAWWHKILPEIKQDFQDEPK